MLVLEPLAADVAHEASLNATLVSLVMEHRASRLVRLVATWTFVDTVLARAWNRKNK